MASIKNIITHLEERGFIDAMTSQELREKTQQPLKVYVGFDPTSDSLHLGNMVGIMGLAWFQKFGHTPVAIVGGATGMIGDPSGKNAERNLLDEKTIEKNLSGIRKSLETILEFNHGSVKAVILNNHDWFKEFNFIDFLRDVGKHFRVGTMLAKESVRTRLSSEEGMSYTEFSYQLLQAYDFLHLFDRHGVILQMGGSDQWGNIIAGTELIRKVRGESAYGLTFPLLTRSDGKKFGKTEEGAIWLNPDKLSPFDFYQYLYRTSDADVIKLFRMLTFLEMEEIREIEHSMQKKDYIPNTAQKRLAEEITKIIHGESGLEQALRITSAAAPGAKTTLDLETLEALAKEALSKTFAEADIIGSKLIDLLVKADLTTSKGEARRLIAGGGVYLNNEKIEDEHFAIESKHLIGKKLLLISVGKKKKMVVKVID